MNKTLQDYIMRIDPFIQEDEIEEVRMINDFDVLFIFKDGRRIIFDSDTNYFRQQYPKNYVLTDEQRKNEFRRRLYTMMRRKGVSQKQLAKSLGTTQAMISRYITGESIPNYITLEKIAEILDCSTDDFHYKHF